MTQIIALHPESATELRPIIKYQKGSHIFPKPINFASQKYTYVTKPEKVTQGNSGDAKTGTSKKKRDPLSKMEVHQW